jgi:hypothetical protein
LSQLIDNRILGFKPTRCIAQNTTISAALALEARKIVSTQRCITSGHPFAVIFKFPAASKNNMAGERNCEAGVTLLGPEVTYSKRP